MEITHALATQQPTPDQPQPLANFSRAAAAPAGATHPHPRQAQRGTEEQAEAVRREAKLMESPDDQVTPAAVPSSRRSLFSSGAALALLGVAGAAAAADANPDAELITACKRFEALNRQYLGLFVGPGRIDDDHDDDRNTQSELIYREQVKLTNVIVDLAPATLAGCQALARATVIWAPDLIEWGRRDLTGLHDYLNVALLRGLAGEAWIEQLFLKGLGRPECQEPVS